MPALSLQRRKKGKRFLGILFAFVTSGEIKKSGVGLEPKDAVRRILESAGSESARQGGAQAAISHGAFCESYAKAWRAWRLCFLNNPTLRWCPASGEARAEGGAYGDRVGVVGPAA